MGSLLTRLLPGMGHVHKIVMYLVQIRLGKANAHGELGLWHYTIALEPSWRVRVPLLVYHMSGGQGQSKGACVGEENRA